MRGINYVTKQLNGDATSSADEEQDEDADVEDDDMLDEDADKQSLNSTQSPNVKGASTSSTIKRKAEIVSLHFCVIMHSVSPDDTNMLYIVQFSRVVTQYS